jgi:hypothetical protein
MTNRYCYLDLEATGLDHERHGIWELAYAIDDGDIQSSILSHSLVNANDKALEVGNYWHRMFNEPFSSHEATIWEGATKEVLFGHEDTLYIVGANPGFDIRFLMKRWGDLPFHYRPIDIESYAMGPLGPLVSDEPVVPQGLHAICETLRTLGWDIPAPDHTAAGDVAATRSAFKALLAINAGETP